MGYLIQSLVLCLAAGAVLSLPTDYEYDCVGLPENFLYWWACGSYGVCRNGKYTQIDCVNGTSYDRRQGACVNNNAGVTYPCNAVPPECLKYDGPGHRYPDTNPDPVENLPICTFYFTCAYTRYLGHQRCSDGTIYDEAQQRCLTANQVAPPCGTYSEGKLSTFEDSVYYAQKQPVVAPLKDAHGNTDLTKWPFTGKNTGQVRGSVLSAPRWDATPTSATTTTTTKRFFNSFNRNNNNKRYNQKFNTNNNYNKNNNRLPSLFKRPKTQRVVPPTNFNPKDFNPAVYGINANEFVPGSFSNSASSSSSSSSSSESESRNID